MQECVDPSVVVLRTNCCDELWITRCIQLVGGPTLQQEPCCLGGMQHTAQLLCDLAVCRGALGEREA